MVEWSLAVLDAIFTDFLRLPEGAQPTQRLLFWVLSAYSKASGDDMAKMRTVCAELEARFGGEWDDRLARMRDWIFGGQESKPEGTDALPDTDDITSTD